jgi:hypothetical protein
MGLANSADDFGRYQRVDTPATATGRWSTPTPPANHNNPGLRHDGWLPPGATRTAPLGCTRRFGDDDLGNAPGVGE